jgi:hypothetical protein
MGKLPKTKERSPLHKQKIPGKLAKYALQAKKLRQRRPQPPS